MNGREERLTKQLVDDAYHKLSTNTAESSDKIVIVLAYNNELTATLAERVNHLICKVSAAHGQPLTFRDRLQLYAPPAVGGGSLLTLIGWAVAKFLLG